MENHLGSSHNRSPNPQASARDGRIRENRRLGYQLKFESTNVSHVDIHSKKVNHANTFPTRSSKLLQKQQDNGKDRQKEELVRYMSNLPSFLKVDVKPSEKTFSVGVLDWKQLERWQHSHSIGNQHSSACSDISSCSSAGGSSSHSTSCHSLPPAKKNLRYPTLQSHFHDTPFSNCTHDTESSEVNKLKAQVCKAVPSRLSGVQQTIIGTPLSSEHKEEYIPKACKVKDLKVTKSSTPRKSLSFEDVKEKMKIHDSESWRGYHKLRTSFDHYTSDEVYGRKQETPRYELGNKHPQIRRSLNHTDIKKIGSKKASHLSFSNTGNFEAFCTEPFCNMPPSRPPQGDSSHPHGEEPLSSASQENTISNDLFQRFSNCGDVSINTSRGKNLQEDKSIPAVEDQVLVNPSKASKPKTVSWGTSNVRNPSPTRRFSFSLSRIGKVSSSSTTIDTSGATEEAAVSSSSLNNSKAGSKGRSSPLRRLLEPLMRPARASLSDSRSSEPASKSSEGHGDCTSQSVKVKLDLKTCKNVDADVPHCSSKLVSSTVQALLQVAVRNGFPLFTFAVDSKNDIYAATLRKSISDKEEFSSIYSFFNVQELKKRGGSWINHGKKDKGNTFVPNIVAQMKVTDSFKQNSLDQSISKEYVLCSFNTKQAETSNHEINDELAAVVVKILKKSSRGWCQNWQGYENSDDSPTSMLKEMHSLSNLTCNIGSGKIEENQTADQFCMTVLLPCGHHGQPIKGEPSSLVKRWQSGGSCDCGGWDLGCRIRVLTENAQFRQRSNSTKSQHTNKLLELFSQDGEDQKPVFSLAPFKDGIYAVEFNSSIEILQAFSISLSILSCLKPVEFVASSNGLDGKCSADFTVSETGGKKVFGKPQTEVPAFMSNPPHSPVGRV